jgi:hypothetical protein
MSDHCPFLLTCDPFTRRYKWFRFEVFWLQLPEFRQLVADSWAESVQTGNKAHALRIKLVRLTKSLKRWNRQRTEEMKQEALTVQQQILQLDQLQDQRLLSDEEQRKRRDARNRLIGLAAVHKIKMRQRSHLTWMKLGDTNPKLFHLRGNAR